MRVLECQECHENPATIHFTKIINGKKTEIHLCESCAKTKDDFFQNNSFTMSNLLSGLFNQHFSNINASNSTISKNEDLKCKECGMTIDKFLKVGRFGCANCYEVFTDRIDPILKRVHSGNTSHSGKIPKRIGGVIHIRKEIKSLKDELQQLIANEEFEQAAELRDKIRELEKGLDTHREGKD